MSTKIEFLDRGIATVLHQNTLRVPPHQRSYKWEADHVLDLLNDIEQAVDDPATEYFLGTMVFTRGDDFLHVADGQQRLATTMILLAAIRDHLLSYGDQGKLIQMIEENYLRTYVMELDSIQPKLSLNNDDNDFFVGRILARPGEPGRDIQATKPSHKRIEQAAEQAADRVRAIVNTPRADQQIERLRRWIMYLRDNATVIIVIVDDPSSAFTIFETLNDRGLKLSQVDLLKNYLYGLAGARFSEVQRQWDGMVSVLEASGYDDIALDYIRQQFISYSGYVKEPELYKKIREQVKTPSRAVEYATTLSDDAARYVALLNPAHPYWGAHNEDTRKAIEVLVRYLKADRIRPLLLSIVRKFDVSDVTSAFTMCISWSVRFMIAGGFGSGTVEKFYAETAASIEAGTMGSPEALAAAMAQRAPNDARFEEAFAVQSVSRNYLARYYLRALENQARRGTRQAILVPEADVEKVDLEHVLPKNPGPGWGLDEETTDKLHRKIGNLVLIARGDNVAMGNDTFDTKKPYLDPCPFILTSEVAKESEWGEAQIAERQKRLAALAVAAWPITASPPTRHRDR